MTLSLSVWAQKSLSENLPSYLVHFSYLVFIQVPILTILLMPFSEELFKKTTFHWHIFRVFSLPLLSLRERYDGKTLCHL